MGQGKAGTSGKDGKDGKDGRDGKPFTFGDLTPSQLEQLKGGPMGTMGPKGDGFNSPEGINYLKANTLWCADGNICQLPKDVPIGAVTGVTAIKLNNNLEVQGENNIKINNGYIAVNPGDKSNYMDKDGLYMRNGNIKINDGYIAVNPGDKSNYMDKDGLYMRNGNIKINDGYIEAGTGDNSNWLDKNKLVIRNGYIVVNPGDISNYMDKDGLYIRNGKIYVNNDIVTNPGNNSNWMGPTGLVMRNGDIRVERGRKLCFNKDNGEWCIGMHDGGLWILNSDGTPNRAF